MPVGAYGGRNYRHLLLDNAVHESTGGQSTVSPAISSVRASAVPAAMDPAIPARVGPWLTRAKRSESVNQSCAVARTSIVVLGKARGCTKSRT